MNEIKELISKFWAKQINPEEQRKLYELINKESDDFKNALQQEFESESHLHKEEISEKRFQDLLEKLHVRIARQEQKPPMKTLVLYHWLKLVAAVLVLGLGIVLSINWLHTHPKQEVTVSNLKPATQTLHQPYNSGKTEMRISLKDGSIVTLQPGSSLSYFEPFSGKNRSISMEGVVTFKVAKDKKHPFIVTARGFTTTALGTAFTINTTKKDRILVNLLEGKVVVKSTSKSGMDLKDVYLVPGQQLAINTRQKEQVVTHFNTTRNSAEVKPAVKMPVPEPLIFNEAPLDHVFDRLAKRYHVQISYEGMDDADLQKLYFTGTFGGTEKLEMMLPTICNMNELTYKRNANNIVISKLK
ncbi:FecR family protein [Pedobacter sp. N23S346]|uniref:FecR family protein n=1 Tax=Pedobacter sp. N23S346 TaxID=3402750 RepID=UPI003AC389AD